MYEDTPRRTPRRKAKTRWYNMIRRCTNPDDVSYPNYGGRGIVVCERWLDFEAYYADVGDAPPGMSLDRVDNDGNYEPGNVRWATPSTQNRNRRPTSSAVAEAARTHCPKGHPYDDENTYRHGNHRYCRRCNTEQKAARRGPNTWNAHALQRHPDGGWGCRCGMYLGRTQEAARLAMPTHRSTAVA